MTTPQEARELAEHYADTTLVKPALRSLASQVEALTAALAKSQPVEQKKCGNTSCAKTDANGGVHDCWYPDCLTEVKPTAPTAAAVLPNGVTASNVYEAYAEGLKAGAQPVEQGEPVRPMSDEKISAGFIEPIQVQLLTAYEMWVTAVRWTEEQHGIKGATE